jgi:hypothetical protein
MLHLCCSKDRSMPVGGTNEKGAREDALSADMA